MRDGRLDGGITCRCSPAVTDMYASGVNAKLLEVTDKQLDDINHITTLGFALKYQQIPTSPSRKSKHFIAQPNILMTTTSIDDQLVYELTETMLKTSEVHQVHSAANTSPPKMR